jgi:RNA polymerase sigma factor (sigma-70 family)
MKELNLRENKAFNFPTETSFKQYLKDIKYKKLEYLTKQQEAELFNILTTGNPQEQAGARNEIINANLKLVISTASKYNGQGLPFEDLVQAGNLGLLNSIDRYDSTKGARFSSFAVSYIRTGILDTVYDQGTTVRVPVDKRFYLYKLKQVTDKIYTNLERSPRIDEIADYVNTNGINLRNNKRNGVTTEIIKSMLSSEQITSSLDFPVDGEGNGDMTLNDVIESPVIDVPIQQIIQDELSDALSVLSPLEQLIVREYYGLDSDDPKGFEEIGLGVGKTGQGVYYIIKKALNKLQKNKKLRELFGVPNSRDYLC